MEKIEISDKEIKKLRKITKNDSVAELKKFIKRNNLTINIPINYSKETILMFASFENSIKIVKYLINKKVNINHIDIDWNNALDATTYNDSYEVANILLKNHISTDTIGRNVMYDALKRKAYKVANLFVKNKIKFNSPNVFEEESLAYNIYSDKKGTKIFAKYKKYCKT